MTTPAKGFMAVALKLVKEQPGLSAEDYATMALDSGLATSNSKDPVQSLATTLMKQVREGKVSEIYTEKVAGKLRYFPTNDLWNSPGRRQTDLLVFDVELSPDSSRRVRLLVDMGLFPSERQAVSWLAEEGVRARIDVLEQIENEAKSIEERRERARDLLRGTVWS